MSTTKKIVIGIVLLLAIVVGVSQLRHKGTLGDATVSNYPTWYYNGIVIGPQNTLLAQLTMGTCDFSGATSIAVNGLSRLTCSAPGAKVGDKVFITTPNRSASGTDGGFPIVGATVSAADTITAAFSNISVGTATPNAQATDDVNYLILR